MRIKINILVVNKKMPATGTRWQIQRRYKYDSFIIPYLYLRKSKKGGETMNKTKMAIIAGIVLCVIVGCIAGGVFN